MKTDRFYWLSAAVIVLALLTREYFVLVASIWHAYAGDSGEYLRYATNMLHGVFSRADVNPTPDAFRTPGYSFLMMLTMLPKGDFYPRLLQAQAILGTLTVANVIVLARCWLPRGWALLAGLLMALWPHEIVATGEMMGEVLLAFLLTGALWLTVLAQERRTLALAVVAGIAWGLAYLVNPIVALFPLVIGVMFWREGMAKQGATLALVSLLAVCGWQARTEAIGGDGSARAYMNLVQGSYPLYHAAFNNQARIPEAKRVMDVMSAEIGLFAQDKAAGFHAMGERIAREPVEYVRWYLSKPYLLWDWDIRIGAGGLYLHPTGMSPLEHCRLLIATTAILRAANPWLFALSMLYALWALWRGPPAARMIALAFLYVTGVHVVLQAEPRYATAYRSLELLLVAGGMCELVRLRSRRPAFPPLHRPIQCQE